VLAVTAALIRSLWLGQEPAVSGKIHRIAKDFIKIQEDRIGKTKTFPLCNNTPLNSGGFLDGKPLVKKGDRVEKGQLFTASNQTRAGHLALGLDLNTTSTPYHRGHRNVLTINSNGNTIFEHVTFGL